VLPKRRFREFSRTEERPRTTAGDAQRKPNIRETTKPNIMDLGIRFQVSGARVAVPVMPVWQ
jgi:hypothetical protein